MAWLKARFWLQHCLKTHVLFVMGAIRAHLSITHEKAFFFSSWFLEGYGKRCWNQASKEAWTGEKGNWFVIFFFVSDAWLQHIFHSFNIALCLFHCSPERQGEWSLCKRRLWNCGEILHRRFNWTTGHAALIHQSGTSKFSFFKHFVKKQIKLNSLIKH